MSDFYNDFDRETLGTKPPEDYRSVFQVDRDRILHSNAFRRLQNKTQVFVSGDYDFYRTRLTHSLEVSQIGKSLVNFLNKHILKAPAIDGDLVEGICLAHDIGNPAFGHAGEQRLNGLMKPYGGFEGNAQTLKIVAETIHESESAFEGMKPSRAFVDGIMKYKILWRDSEKKGKFLYDDQQAYLDFIYGGRDNGLREKSLECQIMEWADDVAYSLHDLSDGYIAGFINEKNIYDWAVDHHASGQDESIINALITKVERREKFDRYIAKRIGQFIEHVTLQIRDNAMSDRSNRYRYGVDIPLSIRQEVALYKRLSFEIIFRSPQVQQLEFKGQQLLERLFQTFFMEDAGEIRSELLPLNIRSFIRKNPPESALEKARLICDYLASQTDRSIVRLYKRLFDPDFGSMVDIV